MNVLDENIIDSQRQQLLAWRIRVRQIGYEVGRKGMNDREEIIPLLHHLRRPAFFTRDAGFYHRTLCHAGYCIVYLRVAKTEVAEYIRRFLRHPEFDTHAKRSGKVVQVNRDELRYWQRSAVSEQKVEW